MNTTVTQAPVTYEYKTVSVPAGLEPLYRDTYRAFGWMVELAAPNRSHRAPGECQLSMKRARSTAHRAELVGLQREADQALGEIGRLEASKGSSASIVAFTIGLIGTVFMALATFSYLWDMLPLMVVFAVPGFMGWVAPYFAYRSVLVSRERKLAPRIDAAYETVYEASERAAALCAA